MNIHRLLCLALAGLWLVSGSIHAQHRDGDEYDLIGYESRATDNPVAKLAIALEKGEVELEYRGDQGYLESLLAVLGVDPASQLLIFSPTSLQFDLISSDTPRAVYFNEDVYVGWVQNSDVIELATLDEKYGLVFYTLNNKSEPKWFVNRTIESCMGCHDTQGTMGGGVPMLSALSSFQRNSNVPLAKLSADGNVGDQTPIESRWGGWYVTGQHGKQAHLGNMVKQSRAGTAKNPMVVGNLDSLEDQGFFDTDTYLRATSDIVALMVLEHQVTVLNQMIYVKFKAPAVLARMGHNEALVASTWDALPAEPRRVMSRMMDKLVQRLLLVDVASLQDRVSGHPDFDSWFQAQGKRDPLGRSLREFDLEQKLFKYPLSYLIHSSTFNTLPAYAKDYVYSKVTAVLEGRDDSENYAYITQENRTAVLQILVATHPDIIPYLSDMK